MTVSSSGRKYIRVHYNEWRTRAQTWFKDVTDIPAYSVLILNIESNESYSL